MLVLHGPAGSGKTATLSLLSQVLGFGIVEWKSPLGSDHSSSGTKSLSAQFDEFLSQSNVFGNLELDDQSTNNRASQVSSDSATRRIILIEEFPSTLSRTSSALIAFRNSLRRYLASIPPPQSYLFGKASPSNDIPPVVIIVSESLLSTNASMSDNFTMHRLLGPEICNHMSTSTIEFNRIAPTFMYKALDLILKKEARHSLRKRIPSPGVLKKFSELGDVRSAISSLEFLCLRGDDSADWGGRVAAKSKNPSRENTSLTIMEKESLEMVTQRESSLGLFHAVGKVVYNKREGTDSRRREDIIAPPSHLQHFERPRISPVSVEDLMNETGTDVQTFSAALHENYPPSCDGTSFVEHLEDCIHYLSDSDLLGSDSRSVLSASRTGVGTARSRHQGYGASIDTLRQDEISFHVAVRGLLFSLPDPVRRSVGQGALSGRRADAYKMYFPTSLRLWKDTEELSGLVDIWERRLLDTASTDFKITRSQGSEQKGVESWKSLNREQISCSGDDDNSQTVIPTSMSRDDLLLYYLPYLSRIRPNSQHAKELEKITQFRGIVAPTDDVPDDELDDYEPSSSINDWTTDPVKTEFSGRPSETLARSRLDSKPQPPPPVEEAVEKLILSDDDIED
jgi:cell cycle checkpoint protein